MPKTYIKIFYYKHRYHVQYYLGITFKENIKTLFDCSIFNSIILKYFFSNIVSTIYSLYFSYKNKIADFPHYDYHMFLITPYYHTRLWNIIKFGRKGTSTLLGTGNHKISKYWFYDVHLLLLYKKLGFLFFIISSLFIIISIILPYSSTYLSLLVLFVLCSSKSFHYFTFVSQNYNSLGYGISSLYIYTLYNQLFIPSIIILFIVSFLSLTASVFLIFITLGFSLEIATPYPLILLIPSILKIYFSINNYSFKFNKNNILFVLKSIGFIKKNVKYKFSKYEKPNFFTIIIFCCSIINYLVNYNHLSYLLIIVVFLIFTNFFIARFADCQSFDALVLISSTHVLLYNNFHQPLDIALLFLLLNTIFFNIKNDIFLKKPLGKLPIVNAFNDFFRNVPRNSRVFFSFKDPNNIFDNCFEDQRFLLDYPIEVACRKDILLFPDFSAVLDHNSTNSISLWSDSPEETLVQMKYFDSKYTICHQNHGTSLDTKWTKLGFKQVASIDWDEFIKSHYDYKHWFYGNPNWFLLEKPKL